MNKALPVQSSDQERTGRIQAWVLLILVLGLLLSFAMVPGLTLSNVGEDFRWRKDLVKAFASFRYIVGDHIFNNTIVGKNGWLYYDGGLSFQEYQRTDLFDPATLNTFQTELDQVNASLARAGTTLLVVIAPDKSTVYPQYMPDQIPVLGKTSRLDQFVDYMNFHSSTRILDLRSVLIRASQTQQSYYRTDSHWNDLGAYYGYYAIAGALDQDYPTLMPHRLSDYTLHVVPGGAITDLPRSMGYLSIPEDDPILEPDFPVSAYTITESLADGTQLRLITNPRSDLPRLLIFGDSFYGALEQFLKPNFSQIVNLPYWAAGGGALWHWVDYARPNIVIIECAERDIQNLVPVLQSPHP